MKKLMGIIFLSLIGVVYAAACPPGSDRFVYPVTGSAGSPVGNRVHPIHGDVRWHNGLDIPALVGTPVYASAGGAVTTADHGKRGYGKHVKITHPNGTYSLYGHLSVISVSNGSNVAQGTKIGEVGSTGGSTGPHLHWETNWANGSPLKINGQTWDRAAGLSRGTYMESGSCINMAAGPGGKVEGDPGTSPSENIGAEDGKYAPGEAPPLPFEEAFTLDGVKLKGLMPEPRTWMEATINVLNEYNIPSLLNSLGLAMLFGFFVYSLASANYFYRSDQYFAILGRLIIAAGLIWGTPAIANSVKDMWFGIYNWMEAQVVKPAVEDLEGHINDFGPWLVTAATVANVAHLSAAVIPDTIDVGAEGGAEFIFSAKVSANVAIDAVEELTQMLAKKADELARLLFALMVLMGSLYGIYFLVIYTSGVIVILAGVLLPVLAPFIVLPGGSSWFTKWLTMIALCLATVTVFPFVMRVVVDQGVSKPIEETNQLGEAMQQQLEYLDGVVSNNPFNGNGDWWNIPEWMGWAKDVAKATDQVAKNLFAILLRWIFQGVILVISVLASIFLMQQIPRLIAGFTGGTFGRAANATTGSVLAGLAVGAAGALGMMGAAKVGSANQGGSNNQAALAAGSSRAALAAGGSQKRLSDSSSSQRSLPPPSPSGEGTPVARGNFQHLQNDPKTVNTTARRVD